MSELSLPAQGTCSSPEPALNITNDGPGGAGRFLSKGEGVAVAIASNGLGGGLTVYHNPPDPAETENPAVFVHNRGVQPALIVGGDHGPAARFLANKTSHSPVVSVYNEGAGSAIEVTSTSAHPDVCEGPGFRPGLSVTALGEGSAAAFCSSDPSGVRPAVTIESKRSAGVVITAYGQALEVKSEHLDGIVATADRDRNALLANGNVFVAGTLTVGLGGELKVWGKKSAVVPTSQGACALYTEESSEVWFTDYGIRSLQDGKAVVEIDPTFAETVDLERPYHVFIQPYGDASIYVGRRGPTSFEVRACSGAHGDVEFSYRLVAKRRRYETARLEHVSSTEPCALEPWPESHRLVPG